MESSIGSPTYSDENTPRSSFFDSETSPLRPAGTRTRRAKKDVGNRRLTHFSNSATKSFPRHLIHHLYDDGETKYLRPRRSHVAGQVVSAAYFQQWHGGVEVINQALDMYEEATAPIFELNLSGHIWIDQQLIQSVVGRIGTTLLTLNINKCSGYMPDDPPAIIESLCSLQNLSCLCIADNPLLVNDDSIDQLVTSMTNLTSIDISGCSYLTDSSLVSIARWMSTRLTELGASRNDHFTAMGTKELMSQCDNLKRLDLSCCPKVTYLALIIELRDGNIHPLIPTHSLFILTSHVFILTGQHMFGSRSLEEVTLDGCKQLHEESLDWLCAANANLRKVSLSEATALSEAALLGLLYACPDLLSLNIAHCEQVTGKALRVIGDKCRYITDVNVANLSHHRVLSQDVIDLLTKCTSLTHLDVAGNEKVGDEVFADFPTLAESTTTSSVEHKSSDGAGKRVLGLTWLSIAHTAFTGFGVACMAERCTLLLHLDLSGLEYVSDAAVSAICSCCRALKELWMDDCPALTDRAVIEAAYTLTHLRSLHLSSSHDFHKDSAGDAIQHSQFTDDALEGILDGARGLLELTLRNQNGIKMQAKWFTQGFARRAGHFSLQRIDLSGCDYLCLKGASNVFTLCSDLCEVRISRRLPSASRGKKFWNSCFRCALYSLSYTKTKQLMKSEDAINKQKLLPHPEYGGRALNDDVSIANTSTNRSLLTIDAGQSMKDYGITDQPIMSASKAGNVHHLGGDNTKSPLSMQKSPMGRMQQKLMSKEVDADFGSPDKQGRNRGILSPSMGSMLNVHGSPQGMMGSPKGMMNSPKGMMNSPKGMMSPKGKKGLMSASNEVAADFGSPLLSPILKQGQNRTTTWSPDKENMVPSVHRLHDMADGLHSPDKFDLESAMGGLDMHGSFLSVGQSLEGAAGRLLQVQQINQHKEMKKHSPKKKSMMLAAGVAVSMTNEGGSTVASTTDKGPNDRGTVTRPSDAPRHKLTAKEEILIAEQAAERELNLPYFILRPHPQADVFRYREKYCRTRMIEERAVRMFQIHWRMHAFWDRIRRQANARRIAWWYKKILMERIRQGKIREFIIRLATVRVQRTYKSHFLLRKRAATYIQKMARGRMGRKYPVIYRARMKGATKIQAWARGWLARLTDRVILARIYLRLPPFWRALMHKAAYRPGNPMSCAIESVRTMVLEQGSVPLGSVPSAFEKEVLRLRIHAAKVAAAQSEDFMGDPDGNFTSLLAIDDSLPGGDGAIYRQNESTKLTDVKEALSDVRDMNHHITHHVLSPKKSKYAQPLDNKSHVIKRPPHIPQSFDKRPYATNDDGRHALITGSKDTLIPEYDSTQMTYRQKASIKAVARRSGYDDDEGDDTVGVDACPII